MTPQHITALAQANATRLARAQERQRIAHLPRPEGHRAVAALLLDPPEHIRSLPVVKLLLWPHRAYQRNATGALALIGASETRKVGQLTERQRRELAGMFARFGEGNERSAA